MRAGCSCLVALWLVVGCTLDRSGVAPFSAADLGMDRPDASRDAGRDAAPRDARPDAPTDARPDARDTGPDQGTCRDGGVPQPETCNGLDDDCSDVIDDGDCQARVPGGSFVMGCTVAEDANCLGFIPSPPHTIVLSAFFIDRTEVTTEAYQRCVSAGTCAPLLPTAPRRPAQPVADVTYDEARVYCAWRGAELPTEAQWERAARGSARLTYPWGTAPWSCERAHGFGCAPDDSLDVGSLPMGDTPDTVIRDLAGNVGEWVLDWASHTYYLESEGATDPQGPATGAERVIRGGGYRDPNPANSVRAAHRGATPPSTRLPGLGFRCARPAP